LMHSQNGDLRIEHKPQGGRRVRLIWVRHG
jgi:hypothetical protein